MGHVYRLPSPHVCSMCNVHACHNIQRILDCLLKQGKEAFRYSSGLPNNWYVVQCLCPNDGGFLFIEARQGGLSSYSAPCCYFSSLLSLLQFQMSTRDQLHNVISALVTHMCLRTCSYKIPTVNIALDWRSRKRETQRGFQAGEASLNLH